jgi:hypothetical protein
MCHKRGVHFFLYCNTQGGIFTAQIAFELFELCFLLLYPYNLFWYLARKLILKRYIFFEDYK